MYLEVITIINSVKYSELNSKGTFASIIGWIDFSKEFQLSNGESKRVVNIIPGGYNISFNISYTIVPVLQANIIQSYTPPVFGFKEIPFGNTAYTGIDGYVILYMPLTTPEGSNTVLTIKISNLEVTDCNNNKITNYTIVAADAETTNKGEVWEAQTDGGPWLLIDIMPSYTGTIENAPTITGIGTNIVTELGTSQDNLPEIASPVYVTSSPTNLTFNLTTNLSREGVALGIIIDQNIVPCPTQNQRIINVCPCNPKCYKIMNNSICQSCTINLLDENNNCTQTQLKSNCYYKIKGNLGVYKISNTDICIYPYDKIYYGLIDIINFQINCGLETYNKRFCFIYDERDCVVSNFNQFGCC